MKEQINTMSSEEKWTNAQYIKSDGVIIVYENYMISDQGRVGCLVNSRGRKVRTMRIREAHNRKDSYPEVTLRFNNKRQTVPIHRLVLSSFCPEGWSDKAEADHIDRNPMNCRLSNLRWLSSSGNSRNSSQVVSVRVTWLDDNRTEIFDCKEDVSKAFGKSLTWCGNVIRKFNGFSKKYNVKIETI